MNCSRQKLFTIVAAVSIGLAAISCSDSGSTPVTQTPTAAEIATQRYVEATDTERNLLRSANQLSSETWTEFVDSIGVGFLGIGVSVDPKAANTALAAVATVIRRADNLGEKLRSLYVPPDCERWHILLIEWSYTTSAAATARRQYIEAANIQGSVNESLRSNVNSANAQRNQIVGDLNAAQNCR